MKMREPGVDAHKVKAVGSNSCQCAFINDSKFTNEVEHDLGLSALNLLTLPHVFIKILITYPAGC